VHAVAALRQDATVHGIGDRAEAIELEFEGPFGAVECFAPGGRDDRGNGHGVLTATGGPTSVSKNQLASVRPADPWRRQAPGNQRAQRAILPCRKPRQGLTWDSGLARNSQLPLGLGFAAIPSCTDSHWNCGLGRARRGRRCGRWCRGGCCRRRDSGGRAASPALRDIRLLGDALRLIIGLVRLPFGAAFLCRLLGAGARWRRGLRRLSQIEGAQGQPATNLRPNPHPRHRDWRSHPAQSVLRVPFERLERQLERHADLRPQQVGDGRQPAVRSHGVSHISVCSVQASAPRASLRSAAVSDTAGPAARCTCLLRAATGSAAPLAPAALPPGGPQSHRA
jgi:hypothetical protein